MAMAFDIQMNQSTLAGSSTNNFSVLGHVVSVQHICDFMREGGRGNRPAGRQAAGG